MSNNLEKKVSLLEKKTNQYLQLDEFSKIYSASKIKKNLLKCKKEIESNINMINNKDEHLLDTYQNITDEQFGKYLNTIKKIRDVLESEKPLSLNDRLVLFLDLTKYKNYVVQYLGQKKEINVKYINSKKLIKN
jgi:hypothetical protein